MNTGAVIQKGLEYVMNTYARYPLVLAKGKGSYVEDVEGHKYLDCVGGIAVCALGHSPDELNEVIVEQVQKLWHISNLYWNQPQVELAEKLVKASGLGKAFFCNSGAEANEAAIKLARKYFYRKQQSHKNEIIVFQNSFHGRTLATLTATGQIKYQEGFAPLPEGFYYAQFNNLDSVKELINDNTCAVMVEPIQGEGGIKEAELDFLRGLRLLCDESGILLIFDEVQTGMGRTGKLFSCQNYSVIPDIMTLAKALGGGFPIGAMLAADEAAEGFAPGDHASTFGGNLLAATLGNKVMDIIDQEDFLAGVKEKGGYFKEKLGKISDGRIRQIRGQGLIIGVDLNGEVKNLIDICRQNGLLVVGAGPQVLRLVPPLNISKAEIDEAVAVIEKSLQEWR